MADYQVPARDLTSLDKNIILTQSGVGLRSSISLHALYECFILLQSQNLRAYTHGASVGPASGLQMHFTSLYLRSDWSKLQCRSNDLVFNAQRPRIHAFVAQSYGDSLPGSLQDRLKEVESLPTGIKQLLQLNNLVYTTVFSVVLAQSSLFSGMHTPLLLSLFTLFCSTMHQNLPSLNERTEQIGMVLDLLHTHNLPHWTDTDEQMTVYSKEGDVLSLYKLCNFNAAVPSNVQVQDSIIGPCFPPMRPWLSDQQTQELALLVVRVCLKLLRVDQATRWVPLCSSSTPLKGAFLALFGRHSTNTGDIRTVYTSICDTIEYNLLNYPDTVEKSMTNEVENQNATELHPIFSTITAGPLMQLREYLETPRMKELFHSLKPLVSTSTVSFCILIHLFDLLAKSLVRYIDTMELNIQSQVLGLPTASTLAIQKIAPLSAPYKFNTVHGITLASISLHLPVSSLLPNIHQGYIGNFLNNSNISTTFTPVDKTPEYCNSTIGISTAIHMSPSIYAIQPSKPTIGIVVSKNEETKSNIQVICGALHMLHGYPMVSNGVQTLPVQKNIGKHIPTASGQTKVLHFAQFLQTYHKVFDNIFRITVRSKDKDSMISMSLPSDLGIYSIYSSNTYSSNTSRTSSSSALNTSSSSSSNNNDTLNKY